MVTASGEVLCCFTTWKLVPQSGSMGNSSHGERRQQLVLQGAGLVPPSLHTELIMEEEPYDFIIL